MAQRNQYDQGTDLRIPADVKTPVRNRFYYGKLLDVYHLEMEQEYFNSKRWLLNRLVTGPGVVCGLDVELTDDEKSVVVMPGLAIDRCGREIIVSRPSRPVPLPPMPHYQVNRAKEEYGQRERQADPAHYCEIPYAHVVLCYHECETDPAPVMAGDCDSVKLCVPGAIREQYEVEIREGYAPERKRAFPDVIEGKRISYHAVIDFVTRACRALPDDCCLPLANIELKDLGNKWEPEINIYVRPIVYSNRLLFDLIQSLVKTDSDDEEGEEL